MERTPNPIPSWSTILYTFDLGPFWLSVGRSSGRATSLEAHGRKTAVFGRWITASVRGIWITLGYDR